MKPARYIFDSPSATQEFAEKLARSVPVGTVIALLGDLGTGKTTFTQGFARGLGIREQVGSPTFKLVSEYTGACLSLLHVDCYRLTSSREFLNIGGENLLDPEEAVTLIEWADRIANILPQDAVTIRFERRPELPERREIIIDGLWHAAAGA